MNSDLAQRQRLLEAAERARRTRTLERDQAKAAGKNVGSRTGVPFSSVASEGACPKCGGDAFKAKRSRLAKVLLVPTVGVGALLAPKTRVKCVTCGTEYLRG